MRRVSRNVALALVAASLVPLPVGPQAEARDREAARSQTTTQSSTIRDRHGYRVGRIDRHPRGDITLRDQRGYRTGTIGRDGTIRNERGFRTGRIDRDR
jgi:hypothetical protein